MCHPCGVANRTIAEQIAVLEARRTALEAAYTSVCAGTASFSVDGLSKTNSNPATISAELAKVEKSLQRLYRGGRGFVLDMSQTESSSVPETDLGDTTLVTVRT